MYFILSSIYLEKNHIPKVHHKVMMKQKLQIQRNYPCRQNSKYQESLYLQKHFLRYQIDMKNLTR